MELFDQSGTVEQFREMVLRRCHLQDVDSILIFAYDANGFTPNTIDAILSWRP